MAGALPPHENLWFSAFATARVLKAPQRSVRWLQNKGSLALCQRATETRTSVQKAVFCDDLQAQKDAAMTTLINNKAELGLEMVMQNNMELQDGCRDALRVSGMGVSALLLCFSKLSTDTQKQHCNVRIFNASTCR